MDRSRVLCKFYSQGTCLKGVHCNFSHDLHGKPHNVCAFYQRGTCSFGSRCRYDHVKVPYRRTPAASISSPSNVDFQVESDLVQTSHFPSNGDFGLPSDGSAETSTLVNSLAASVSGNHEMDSRNVDGKGPTDSKSEQPICSFTASGSCPCGLNCSRIHGEFCHFCERHGMNPFRPNEQEEHMKSCHMNAKRLETLKLSEELECSVCYERVLSKPTAADRKFGLLPQCDHPFCISCIRNWRSNAPSSGMDVNSAARACPVCRKLSYFVVPSVSWYSTKEEKQEIIANYKAKLKSINCKYFDFGNGVCPFGASCFYKHHYDPEKIRPRTSRRAFRPPLLNPPGMNTSELDELIGNLIIHEAFEHLMDDEYEDDLFSHDGFDIEDEDDDLSPLGLALLLMELNGDGEG